MRSPTYTHLGPVRSGPVRLESPAYCDLPTMEWTIYSLMSLLEQAKSTVILLPKTKSEWKWRVCIYSDKGDIQRGASISANETRNVRFPSIL